MAMTMEASMHSYGNLRCHVREGDGYVSVTLKDKDSSPGAVDGFCIFVETPAEIAAFKALAEALAAQDVVAEEVM